MQVTAPQKGIAAGNIVNVESVMQEIAEHKGCGTTGGSGKASCGSAAGRAAHTPRGGSALADGSPAVAHRR